MRHADWYFDFISPFSYLQLARFGEWPRDAPLRPKPVLLAALLDHWGQKGPGEIPAKRTFTYRQVLWRAEREGVPLRFPPRHPFNPLRTLRLAVALDADLGAIREIYRFVWAEGREVDSEDGWRELAKRLGVTDADAKVASPEVKAALRSNGEEAIAAGVFGVPTLVIDGTVFWGSDATAMAIDYLRDPARFGTAEMRRVDALPVGATRSR